jgi:hypothetical protein
MPNEIPSDESAILKTMATFLDEWIQKHQIIEISETAVDCIRQHMWLSAFSVFGIYSIISWLRSYWNEVRHRREQPNYRPIYRAFMSPSRRYGGIAGSIRFGFSPVEKRFSTKATTWYVTTENANFSSPKAFSGSNNYPKKLLL